MTEKKNNILTITLKPCVKCEKKHYKYNPPEARKHYKGEIIIGKYECIHCNEQYD